jgi:hypothetical protein
MPDAQFPMPNSRCAMPHAKYKFRVPDLSSGTLDLLSSYSSGRGENRTLIPFGVRF